MHGMPSKEGYYNPETSSESNKHWIPWLQRQLQLNEIDAQTPEIFMSFQPEYAQWKKEFERFDINSETVLVGHSLGGGFIVRWLSENKDKKVGNVVLVAPWLDTNKSTEYYTGTFFDFEIDENMTDRTNGISLFISDDDSPDQQESAKVIIEKIKGVNLVQFYGYGHFTQTDMKGRTDFPELLKECLKAAQNKTI